MNTKYTEQIKKFNQLNKVASRGGAVFLGSTFMESFPFYELCKYLDLNVTVYNRSLAGLRASEALEVYREAASAIGSKKIFVNIGEEEAVSGLDKDNFLKDMTELIAGLKSASPKAEICLLSVMSADSKYDAVNAVIKEAAGLTHVSHMNLKDSLLDEDGNLDPKFLTADGEFTVTAYIAIWRKLYHRINGVAFSMYDTSNLSKAVLANYAI